MRIDNHMAGYRPPPPKSKNKGITSSSLIHPTFQAGHPSSSSMFNNQGNKAGGEDRGRNSAQQKVHKHRILEKIVHTLTTRGVL